MCRRDTVFTLQWPNNTVNVAVHEDTFETAQQIRLVTPIVLIQLYRQEYHALTREWESYVPVPGYRYPITCRRAPIRRDAGACDMYDMEMATTHDPLMARDPDGEQLAHDMEELEFIERAITMPARLGDGPDYYYGRVRRMESFAPPENAAEMERRHREQERQQHIQDQYARALHQMRMDDLHRQQFQQAYQQAAPGDVFTLQHLQLAREAIMRTNNPFHYEAPNAEAEKKAWELLKAHLTPEQNASLERQKYFFMVGQNGTGYHIHIGKSHNIDILSSDGTPIQTICFAPTGNLATGDVMLTQKLALEVREGDALAVANHWGGGAKRRGPDTRTTEDYLREQTEMRRNIANAMRQVQEERLQQQVRSAVNERRRGRGLGSLFGGGWW